ncbi:MAG: Nif11-like leader peptide family natural product precursor [Bacillota bacterium]
MSIEKVKEFFERVEGDKALQEQLKALDQKAKVALDDAIDELVEIAKTQGFAFTPKDFVMARNEQAQSIVQLDQQVRAECKVFTGGGCSPGMGLYVTVPFPHPDPPTPPPQEPPCSGTYQLQCNGHPFR